MEATRSLLETVREVNPGVDKVLVTSSLAVVGACPEGVATEETPLRPISRYGKSKKRMEEVVRLHPDHREARRHRERPDP